MRTGINGMKFLNALQRGDVLGLKAQRLTERGLFSDPASRVVTVVIPFEILRLWAEGQWKNPLVWRHNTAHRYDVYFLKSTTSSFYSAPFPRFHLTPPRSTKQLVAYTEGDFENRPENQTVVDGSLLECEVKAAEEPRTLGRRGYAWPGLPPPFLAFMAVKDLCSDRYTEGFKYRSTHQEDQPSKCYTNGRGVMLCSRD
ncbi:hypothetical protein Q8A73_020414 [Channa argus]|nr:hypothetical protein Q8A73_020414 [Channa argus]